MIYKTACYNYISVCCRVSMQSESESDSPVYCDCPGQLAKGPKAADTLRLCSAMLLRLAPANCFTSRQPLCYQVVVVDCG
jgi:hypothetical protein